MRQCIGERYYGTQHTMSGYPLNRKSVSCPRMYRAFLVTFKVNRVLSGIMTSMLSPFTTMKVRVVHLETTLAKLLKIP